MSKQSLHSLFTKSDFDYNCDLDLHKFHPQIRIFLALNGIFSNNPDSKIRLIWPSVSVLIALMGSSFELMFIYHGVTTKDYSFATECFTYFIIVTTVPIIITSVFFNRETLVTVLGSMNRDFMYICSLEPKYRNTFLEGNLHIWKLCILWFVFIVTILSLYILSTVAILMYQSLFATQTETMIRPLMFPSWLPGDDSYRTPNYEMFMTYEIMIILVFPQAFCVYIYLLFHILLHYYYVMSLIIYDTEVLFDGLDSTVIHLPRSDPSRIQVQLTLNNRIRRIVKWHNLVFKSIEAVSLIYGPPIVYQVMFSSLPICLMAYQVAAALEEGRFQVLFTLTGLATCIQLWIPCYLGSLFKNKAFSVGEALWNCGWQENPLGQLIRQDIILIIMRSQKPVSIKFTGLLDLELKTFSSIMSTSYSYFNILRQYK